MNPENLPRHIIGNGYRTLDEDEYGWEYVRGTVGLYDDVDTKAWFDDGFAHQVDERNWTYRTKLTREQLFLHRVKPIEFFEPLDFS